MAYVILHDGDKYHGIHFPNLEMALKFVRATGSTPWRWWQIMNPINGRIMVQQY